MNRFLREAEKTDSESSIIGSNTHQSSDNTQENNYQSVETLYLQNANRLQNEATKQGKKANLNLMIGTAWVWVGLCYAVILIKMSPIEVSWEESVIYFLPRLSIFVLIEFFAFYFVRLYKSGLEDTKYFQNELTNLQNKQTAIALIREEGNKNYTLAIESLLSTERNMLLNKGQSTVALEKAKLESSEAISSVDLAFKVFDKMNRRFGDKKASVKDK